MILSVLSSPALVSGLMVVRAKNPVHSILTLKQAVFDIADDKAPGPDGYSSGFFKAAWPVVGQEVTKAVLEFFSTGKLLKQVNSTLLALIPKVHTLL